MNFFEGSIRRSNGALVFSEDGFDITIPPGWLDGLGPFADRDITFGIRPEDIGSPQAEQVADAPRIKATVEVVEPMGSETNVYLTTGKTMFISRMDAHRQPQVGETMDLAVFLNKAHFFGVEDEKAVDLPR